MTDNNPTPFPAAEAVLASVAVSETLDKVHDVERRVESARESGNYTPQGLNSRKREWMNGVGDAADKADAAADKVTKITADAYTRRFDELTTAPDTTADQLKVSRQADLVNYQLQNATAENVGDLVRNLAANGDIYTRAALRESAGPILEAKRSALDGNQLVELGVLQADETLQALSHNKAKAAKLQAVLKNNAKYLRGRIDGSISHGAVGYIDPSPYL